MGSHQATKLHAELVKEWSKGAGADEGALKKLLSLLKIELSELGLLFPTAGDASTLDVGALTTARDILEIGAFQSIRSKDVPSFERYLSLLGAYYNDLPTLPKSLNEAPLLALSLLRLLSQNRIAEFHTLLETLSREIVDSSEVAWVTYLERSLMEGSYSRVWALCRTSSASATGLPRPEFAFFVETLIGTVRNEIASCDERAYASLPIADAKTLLFFDNDGEVREFAKSRGWFIDPHGTVHFPSSENHPSNSINAISTSAEVGVAKGKGKGIASDKELNKERAVSSMLAYATKLETIV